MMNFWLDRCRGTFVVSVLLTLGCFSTTAQTKPAGRSNLVFVFADQLSFDMLGAYGNTQVITPNLDRFAQQSIKFTHCFTNSPVCTPYRGLLMSGQHSLNNGAVHNDKPLIPGSGKKFAEVLRDEGYSTAYIGKWHLLGGDRRRPVPAGEMRYGFDELFYTNNCHVDYRPGKCFFWNDNDEREYFDEWEVFGQTNQALEYLRSRKESDKPFALFVSWHPPHDWGKFKGNDGKMHYRYDSIDTLMSFYHPDTLSVRPGTEDSPDIRRMYHGHMAMISGVDIAFGRLMEQLTDLGLDENTLVIFTSDHGDMLEFQSYMHPKSAPHDYSMRVPLIMHWPGRLRANSESSLLVGAMDLMPTILGMLDLDVPREVDGRDLSDYIFTNKQNAVKYIPVWLYHPDGFKGVITKSHTYTFSTDTPDNKYLNVFYNRSNDPNQLENNFLSNKERKIRNKLHRYTRRWMSIYQDHDYTGADIMNVASQEQWVDGPYMKPVERLKLMTKEE